MPPRSRKAKPAPKIKVEVRAVASLVPDPANAMKHGERNILAIRGSLRQFGQQKPLIISRDGVVVAGNGTLQAAVEEGWEWIECKVFNGPAADARAYAIVDNKSAQLAEWERDILSETLREMPEELQAVTGFTELEIDRLLSAEDQEDPAVSEPGEAGWRIIIECSGEKQQQALMERLEAEGIKCWPAH